MWEVSIEMMSHQVFTYKMCSFCEVRLFILNFFVFLSASDPLLSKWEKDSVIHFQCLLKGSMALGLPVPVCFVNFWRMLIVLYIREGQQLTVLNLPDSSMLDSILKNLETPALSKTYQTNSYRKFENGLLQFQSNIKEKETNFVTKLFHTSLHLSVSIPDLCQLLQELKMTTATFSDSTKPVFGVMLNFYSVSTIMLMIAEVILSLIRWSK